MATIVVETPVIEKASGRTREHLFFGGMSAVIALVVFVGFARTYYLAGMFGAKPLASPIVHIHGAVFTCWLVLLLVQTTLAGTGHARAHRRLGLLGLGLAPLMVVLGVVVAFEMLRRFAPVTSVDSPLIFAVALSEVTGFAVPVFFAFRLRRRSADHKRLIMAGTIATTTAGFGRWPVALLLHRPLPAMLAAFMLLALLAAYDRVSMGRVHRATLLGAMWVVFIELTGFALGHTAAWHAFAVHARSFAAAAAPAKCGTVCRAELVGAEVERVSDLRAIVSSSRAGWEASSTITPSLYGTGRDGSIRGSPRASSNLLIFGSSI